MKKLNNFNAPKGEGGARFRKVTRKSRDFTQIPNQLLRDKRLRPDATWLICLLLSYPDDWQTSFTAIQKVKDKAIGRDALRAMIKNAIESGYMIRSRYQLDNGQFSWEYIAFESPDECEEWKRENLTDDETIDGLPVDGNSGTIDGFSTDGRATDGRATDGLPVDIHINKYSTNTYSTNIHKRDAGESENFSLSGEPASKESVFSDSLTAQISNQLQEIESQSLSSHTNTSASLIENSKSMEKTDNPSPGSKNSAATFLQEEETAITSPRENASRNYEEDFKRRAEGLPVYRVGRGKNGIKPEFIEVTAKYLNTTPHYRESGLKAGDLEAKNYIIDQEYRKKQEILEDRYRKYCPTPKSTGVEGNGKASQVETLATTNESLVKRVKSGGLMSKWNQTKSATEV